MYLLGRSPFPFDSSSSITFLLCPNFLCFLSISSKSLFIWSCFGLLTAFLTVYTQIPNTSLHPVGRPRNTRLPPGFPSGRSHASQPRRRPVGTIADMAPRKTSQQKKASTPGPNPRPACLKSTPSIASGSSRPSLTNAFSTARRSISSAGEETGPATQSTIAAKPAGVDIGVEDGEGPGVSEPESGERDSVEV
jgi:hypothetical protein